MAGLDHNSAPIGEVAGLSEASGPRAAFDRPRAGEELQHPVPRATGALGEA